MSKYIKEDLQKCIFKVNRKAFTDSAILELEREAIFSKCWLFIGHESELPNNGDFHRRKVGGRNLLFTRGN
ncbi:MAG: aromatic ring-hydroxylating dioxygenase subunit alpha, partial [Bacillota bacterium]|nr:aromatic ring-hydroxylating dioxygenase subunit alpha [Bacillota bacterium]